MRSAVLKHAHPWGDDGVGGDCTYTFPGGMECAYPAKHAIHIPADAPTKLAEYGESEADRIDAAIIRALDAGAERISANDIRAVLDSIADRNLIGKRFAAARASGVLLWIRGIDGTVPSSLGSTKGHEIKAYRPGPAYARRKESEAT